MENDPVGFRFRPTDVEIIDHYLRIKNLANSSSHVDKVDQAITTVNICNFDPWDLPSQSRTEQSDRVWYFFGCKENKYKRGDKQSRTTKSGFWKKTGPTMNIFRKRGNREKIGEKKVLVFHMSKILGGLKTNWVIHEYHSTSLSPNQMVSYTVCKVKFKGEEGDLSSSSGCEIGHSHSFVPHMNNSGGLGTGSERLPIELPYSQELENPPMFSSGFLDEQKETQLEDINQWDFDNISSDDWKNFLDDDVVEQSNSVSMQPDCSDYGL